MGPPIYYVVRVISNNESIVVPDLWITNGMCLWPKSNPEDKAKNRIFKPDWPQRGPVVLTSAHLTYDEANARRRDDVADSTRISESDSVQRSISQQVEFSSRRSSRNQKFMEPSGQQVPTNRRSDKTTPSTDKRSNKTTAQTLDKQTDKRNTLAPVDSDSDDENVITIPKTPENLIRNGSQQTNVQCNPVSFVNIADGETPLKKKRSNEEVDNEIVSTADNGKSAKFPRLSSNFQRMNDFPTPSTSSASYCQSSLKYNEGYDSESGSETDGERGVSFNNRGGNRKTQDKEIVLTPAEKMILREIKNVKRYVRSIGRNVDDVKSEQRDQRKLLGNVRSNDVAGERRHPVFEQDVTMPLTTVEDFNTFETKLANPEIRNHLIEAIRAFGGTDIGDIVREAWKQVMADCLMRKFTWKGQLKKGISSDDKEREALCSSKLKMALYEAVRCEKFDKHPITELDKISENFVRRADGRFKDKEKQKRNSL